MLSLARSKMKSKKNESSLSEERAHSSMQFVVNIECEGMIYIEETRQNIYNHNIISFFNSPSVQTDSHM